MRNCSDVIYKIIKLNFKKKKRPLKEKQKNFLFISTKFALININKDSLQKVHGRKYKIYVQKDLEIVNLSRLKTLNN